MLVLLPRLRSVRLKALVQFSSVGAISPWAAVTVSTTFSGSIEDCGINCQIGGSLTKIGTGSLTLSGANTYTGVTTVSAGALLVTTRPSSGTGNNKVKVNAGTLGGTGVIGGAVTIGMGSGAGAFSRLGQPAPAAYG